MHLVYCAQLNEQQHAVHHQVVFLWLPVFLLLSIGVVVIGRTFPAGCGGTDGGGVPGERVQIIAQLPRTL